MAYFIELRASQGNTVLVNVESISYVEPLPNGAIIHLLNSNNPTTIHVKESYYSVKRMISDYE